MLIGIIVGLTWRVTPCVQPVSPAPSPPLQPLPLVSNPSIPARDPEAVALATAMLIHDRSIHSMEWSDEVLCAAPGLTNAWWPLHRCREGEDESGRFYQHFMNGYRDRDNPNPTGFKYVRGHLFSEDGLTQIGYQERDPEHESAVIGPVGPDMSAYWSPSPPMFLGRRIALYSWRSLGELLLEAQELRIDVPENEQGVVRLRGVAYTGAYWSDLLVDIDTRHGYMPVRIENRDAYTLLPHEIITVSQQREFEGIFLPIAGQRETYTSVDLSADQLRAFEASLRRHGLDMMAQRHPEDARERASAHAAMAEAFGPQGYPRRPAHASSPQRVESTDYLSVNKPLTAGARFEVPAQWRVFNLWDFMADGRPEESPDAEDAGPENKP